MVYKSETMIEGRGPSVAMLDLKMKRANIVVRDVRDNKLKKLPPNSLRAVIAVDYKFVDEGVSATELQTKAKADHHRSDNLFIEYRNIDTPIRGRGQQLGKRNEDFSLFKLSARIVLIQLPHQSNEIA